MAQSELEFILIKPSHYDDDGYPITWWRGLIPSNTLAVMNGIAADCAERQVLGPGISIRLRTIDETNSHVVPDRIIREVRRRGSRVLIGLVGVQSNQFDRAMDLARAFRTAGLPVIVGGFHISGCLAMLKTIPGEIQAALDLGVSLFAGECEEGRLDEVLQDAWAGSLKPIYNHLADLPSLAGAPLPLLPADAVRRNIQGWSSFDLGRGCPFQCSFCTIINVQGRKSRFRTADDLEAIVRENHAQGVKAFFITDDNLARNRHWEAFFDRLIKLREEEGMKVNLTLQVDTLCHRIPGFIDKARRAGAMRVFIGLENINPDNLIAANKRQNKITEYRAMLQQWHERGVFTFAGYILGFPADSRESILRDIEIIKRELPLDVLEFFVLTPLPGSEDHRRMLEAGEWMDPDLNKYNLHHRVSHHPRMSDHEWDEAIKSAWNAYFTWEHIETVGRRHAVLPANRPKKAIQYMVEFKMLNEIEGLHALEGGIVRRKRRLARRPGHPIVPAVIFYPRVAAESAFKLARYLRGYLKTKALIRRILSDPERHAYTDASLAPSAPEDFETLGLFQDTHGGADAVARQRRHDTVMETVRSARTGATIDSAEA